MVSRDEAGLRQGLTDELAKRVHDPDGAGFSEGEEALLHALPLLATQPTDAIDRLRPHFDRDSDRGEIAQIITAYGMYRGLHLTNAALGVSFVDDEGRPFPVEQGFHVVTMDDGSFQRRADFEDEPGA